MNTAVIEFLTNNPNSNKGQIADGINLRGLGLFNLLKKMVNEGQIQVEGEGHDATYWVATTEAIDEEVAGEQTVVETSSNETTHNSETTEEVGAATDEAISEQPKQDTVQPSETKPAKKNSGRNTGTYLFSGISLNKGKLINSVVAAHCAKNKNMSEEKLRAVFPDSLLKRFGIFQTVEKAREISGAKYDRYFFKEEFQIKLKDCVIVTCNQITSENILPFLEVCAKLGYEITAE